MAAEIAHGVGGGGLPAIIGGDWQSAPTEVHAAGIDRRMAATIVAPVQGEYTCTTRKDGSCIDYFLIASPIAATVTEVAVDMTRAANPHRPVCVTFASLWQTI